MSLEPLNVACLRVDSFRRCTRLLKFNSQPFIPIIPLSVILKLSTKYFLRKYRLFNVFGGYSSPKYVAIRVILM